MTKLNHILHLLTAVALLSLCGCATNDAHRDEKEYSDMPWNTPQQWEGSQTMPGMTPQY